ncbi:MAG: hypothetical protein WCG27_08910, partial [Pseudomonadota bacterium]
MLVPTPAINTVCPASANKEKMVIAGPNSFAINLFDQFLSKNSQAGFNFIDQAVLWSLLQMNVRPDLVSPTARLQIFINNGANTSYYDFNADHYPFLFGLDLIAKKYAANHQMEGLGKFLKNSFLEIPIAQDMAQFIVDNSKMLSNVTLQKYFFKADQPLITGEALPRLDFVKIIELFRHQIKSEQSPTHTPSNIPLIPFSFNQSQVACNADLQIYQKNIYQISPTINPHYFFALADHQGRFFLAAVSQNLDAGKDEKSAKTSFIPIMNTFLLKGNADTSPAIFCLVENPGISSQLALMSGDDRDPGQHLYHLLNHDLSKTQNLNDVKELINFARYLFLLNPMRLLFEDARSREKQLDRFLS